MQLYILYRTKENTYVLEFPCGEQNALLLVVGGGYLVPTTAAFLNCFTFPSKLKTSVTTT